MTDGVGLDPVDPLELAAGIFSDEEFGAYRAAGYGQQARPGSRPALLVVDVTYAFTGDRAGEEAYPLSCGGAAWEAIDRIRDLLAVARGNDVPVIYSRNSPRRTEAEAGGWLTKLNSGEEPPRAHDIVDEIAPLPSELVVTKAKPSAFFATPLATWLVKLGVDTVLVAGGSTSGCVRATVVDAFSWNFNPFVIADATFDRSPTSHRVNLFEMNQKYASVVGSEQTRAYLSTVKPGSRH
jgi:nicotinamidase-related amidase